MLVKVHAADLCHTDLETIQGSLAYPPPPITGHEGAGVVEAVGSAVTAVAPGDHVLLSWNPSCGHCFNCDRDQPIQGKEQLAAVRVVVQVPEPDRPAPNRRRLGRGPSRIVGRPAEDIVAASKASGSSTRHP